MKCLLATVFYHPKDVKLQNGNKVMIRNESNTCQLAMPSDSGELVLGGCYDHNDCPSMFDLRDEFVRALAMAQNSSDKAKVWAGEQSLRKESLLRLVTGSRGSRYEIRRGSDNVIYCTCPRWRFKKTCKHLKAYEGSVESP